MTTDAKMMLECMALGYAMASEENRKRITSVLPLNGWERTTGGILELLGKPDVANGVLQRYMQLMLPPSEKAKNSTMAYIVEVLTRLNDKVKFARSLETIKTAIMAMDHQELDRLNKALEGIKHARRDKTQEATTGPAHSVSAPQPVAHGAGDGKALTPNAGQRKE